MAHNHQHHHHAHHGHDSSPSRSLYVAAFLTFSFALVEVGAGWWANSLALLSDAGHMFTDAAALLIASLGAWLAQRRPSLRHSYGLGRAEFIAALVNGVFMIGVIGGIVYHAIDRLADPPAVRGEAMTVVAMIGLLINVVVLRMLGHADGDLNRRAAALHVVADLLGSIAALLAGVVIVFTGWTPIDPILSLVIVMLIMISTVRLLREALHGLMEGVPFGLSLQVIGLAMAARPGVRSVHDLHVWSLSSRSVALSAHVLVNSLQDWPAMLDDLRAHLHAEFGIDHVTLQPEIVQAVPLVRIEDSRASVVRPS